ncbi:MAG: hypothetical protein U1A78_10825 [Polyangia bacterium]
MGPARKPRLPGAWHRGPARRVAVSASLLLGLCLGTAAAEEPPPPESVEPAAPTAPVSTPPPAVPAADGRPPCVLTPGADGRLSGVAAADGNPLARGGCRHGDFSGTLLTYHRSGAVAEILPVKAGLLDGVLEVYDELGHLLRRELWQDGALRPLAQLPLGEPLTPSVSRPEAPRPPPPLPGPAGPTPAATADPSATAPEPAAPSPAPSPPPRQSPFGYPSPGRERHLALNVARGGYGTLAQLGPGLDLLVALSDRLVVELRSQLLETVSGPEGYLRRDVPITLGLRTRFGTSVVQPYLVAAIGTDYARRTIPGDIPSQPSESAWLLDAHAGAGLTVSMSRSWSLVGEFRLGARLRVDGGPRLMLPDESGAPQVQLGSQLNTQFCLGLALSL